MLGVKNLIMSVFVLFFTISPLLAKPFLPEESIEYSNPEKLITDLLDQTVQFNSQEDISSLDSYNFYRELANRYMDMENISLVTLGPYRRKINEEQKKQFVPLFEDYVILKIMGLEDRFLKGLGEGQFKKVRNIERKPGYHQIIYRHNINRETIDVIWTVIKHKNTGFYKIYDFHIEGISLLQTERAIFSKVLQRDGVEGLIAKLEEWISKLEVKYL